MKVGLSPKELGAAIGVSESSLKRWADSGRLSVARTAGGHRRIHLSEAVRFIRAHGFVVERPEILGLDDLGASVTEPVGGDPAQAFHDALAAGDAERARGLALAQYMEGTPLAQIVDRLIAPAMRAIGERWRHGEDGIMVEHRAADICSQILDRVRGLAVAGDDGCSAVGGAAADDPYVLPSLMAAAVLASEGWDEINLAANTPTAALVQAAQSAQPRLVWLACSVERPTGQMREQIAELRAGLDRAGLEAGIAVGGPALTDAPPVDGPGVYHARSMTELAAFARGLRARERPGPGREGRASA